jgi:hypothetical protein
VGMANQIVLTKTRSNLQSSRERKIKIAKRYRTTMHKYRRQEVQILEQNDLKDKRKALRSSIYFLTLQEAIPYSEPHEIIDCLLDFNILIGLFPLKDKGTGRAMW